MQLSKLFSMQTALDQHIEENHGLKDEDLFDRKVLALLVEIGELANETRCFKFWSVKPSSEKEVILMEFVDGVHFILSLGIECGFQNSNFELTNQSSSQTVTEQFLDIYEQINIFRKTKSLEDYQVMFDGYFQLASLLGLTNVEIEQAYFDKNEVNYQRQQNGY
jgi:dimeric dUTPase (all-alpha-NTP-PPase superfamily)